MYSEAHRNVMPTMFVINTIPVAGSWAGSHYAAGTNGRPTPPMKERQVSSSGPRKVMRKAGYPSWLRSMTCLLLCLTGCTMDAEWYSTMDWELGDMSVICPQGLEEAHGDVEARRLNN